MARAGRKRKEGRRHPGGKLVVTPKIDHGTAELRMHRMQRIGAVPDESRALWLSKGAEAALVGTMPTRRERKAGATSGVPAMRLIDTMQTIDPIGRAWMAGMLEGFSIEADDLRDTARRFATLYWRKLPDAQGSPVSGLYRNMISGLVEELPAGVSRERELEDADARDERQEAALNRMLATLRRAGHDVRRDVDALALDPFADAGPTWLDWLIVAKARHADDFERAVSKGERSPEDAQLRPCDWHLYAPGSGPYMVHLRRAVDGLTRLAERA